MLIDRNIDFDISGTSRSKIQFSEKTIESYLFDSSNFDPEIENKLKNVTYYRVDIATSPISRKKYRIRMAPTLILFVDGVKTKAFKAGLDLVLKEDLLEIQSSIDEAKLSSQF